MKLIQAMKKLKDLKAKADDLKDKVAKNCADLNIETQLYADQKRQVSEWMQAHHDVLKEILALRVAIQRTNLATLGDRNLKEQNIQTAPGGPVIEVRIRRYFDPVERDKKMALYRSEPSVIDGHLEIVNATTELIEE